MYNKISSLKTILMNCFRMCRMLSLRFGFRFEIWPWFRFMMWCSGRCVFWSWTGSRSWAWTRPGTCPRTWPWSIPWTGPVTRPWTGSRACPGIYRRFWRNWNVKCRRFFCFEYHWDHEILHRSVVFVNQRFQLSVTPLN